jgi:hypothetical protein
MEDDVEIDSRFAVDGSIVEYKDKVDGFSQTKGVAHDVTLASRFSRDEGVDLVQVVSVVEGFEVHERDSHVDKLLITLHRLLPIPRAWYFKIKELTCVDFYLCDF